MKRLLVLPVALVALVLTACGEAATSNSSGSSVPGVTDTEIHLGATTPLTGPAASYSESTVAAHAYFDSVNAQGGINGRKIKYTILDDAYDPSKTVPLTQRLVDQEKVFAIFASAGSVTQAAVYKRLQSEDVPDVLIGSGADLFLNPVLSNITILLPSFGGEQRLIAGVVKDKFPGKKLGLFSQNDEVGQEAVKTYKGELGSAVVAAQTYEVTDPSVSSQVTSLKNAGVEVVVCSASPKFLALALRAAQTQGYHPQFICNGTAFDSTVLKNAGDAAEGLLVPSQFKNATDESDPAVKQANDVVRKYAPSIQPGAATVRGVASAQIMVAALKTAGRDLTRDSLRKALDKTSLDDGTWYGTVTMSPTDHDAVECEQLQQVTGGKVSPIGKVICPQPS